MALISEQLPVLIVGAGPTGLILALSLARRKIPFRIIDQHRGPGEESRAMGVHARTLEFYRQFGFANEIVSAGVPADVIHLRSSRGNQEREVRSFSLKEMGKGLSPYPFLLTYPQDLHERLLVGKLKEQGVAIERSTTLVDFEQNSEGVRATVEAGGHKETITASYIVGCDGARSRVREVLKLGFSGGTYEQLFFVADVKIDRGFDKDIYVNLGAKSLAIMMPVRATGMQRLIGLVPDHLKSQSKVSFEDFRAEVEPLLSLRVTEVNWFSTYRVHHRVADHFHVGRAFVAGDAGHLHSPAGGQGMNTGIGDAINLGWKLATVLSGRAKPEILDTYESERLPFARELVATTDRAFESMVAEGFTGNLVRNWLAPSLVGVATKFDFTRHMAFRKLSQIGISYPESALSEGNAGINAGDRLPWVPSGDHDNFAPLSTLEWQVHVYGEPQRGLDAACAERKLDFQIVPWSDEAQHAGLVQNGAYLIRPDGYVALASKSDTAVKLSNYVERWGLSFGESEVSASKPRGS